jgi:hypothetical protein
MAVEYHEPSWHGGSPGMWAQRDPAAANGGFEDDWSPVGESCRDAESTA